MLKNIGKYLMNILIWIDQGVNVVFLLGDPDETISSRIGKAKVKFGGEIPYRYPVLKFIDWGLDKLDPNHSIDAIEEDEGADQVNDWFDRLSVKL